MNTLSDSFGVPKAVADALAIYRERTIELQRFNDSLNTTVNNLRLFFREIDPFVAQAGLTQENNQWVVWVAAHGRGRVDQYRLTNFAPLVGMTKEDWDELSIQILHKDRIASVYTKND